MKKIFLALAIFVSFTAAAQVSKVTVQAGGLTCSMCSNSITKALKTLSFADGVFANISSSSFDIKIKPGSKVSFDEIKKKVEDAGFFVANMKATVHFKGEDIAENEHVKVDGLTFHFLNVKDQTLTGDRAIQIVDKGYVSAKTFKKNEAFTKMDCYKTGVAGSCCAKGGLATGTRIYHVTI